MCAVPIHLFIIKKKKHFYFKIFYFIVCGLLFILKLIIRWMLYQTFGSKMVFVSDLIRPIEWILKHQLNVGLNLMKYILKNIKQGLC